MAPSTMEVEGSKGKKRIKTDKRDAQNITKCLAYRLYSPVHIPTDEELQIKEYVRMRDDHKHQLKSTKTADSGILLKTWSEMQYQ